MRIEIETAQVTFHNGGCSHQRAENISRLTFEYVHQLVGRRRPTTSRREERISATPLRLELNAMSDQQVARATARAVLLAMGSMVQSESGN